MDLPSAVRQSVWAGNGGHYVLEIRVNQTPRVGNDVFAAIYSQEAASPFARMFQKIDWLDAAYYY
jgi:hypothetical protein